MKKTILFFSAWLSIGCLSAQDKTARVNPIIGTNGMGHTFPGLASFRTGSIESGHGHDPS